MNENRKPEAGNGKPETGNRKLGVLYGLGVGPGDPKLVTLGALEVIRRVPVVAFPVHKKGAASRAYETVKEHVPAGTERLPLFMPMTRSAERLQRAHEEAVAALIEAAAVGRDIACLTVGDPLFYSTFGYLAQRFPGRVEVISGVTAMNACAAAVGSPLAEGDIPTVVVTGADHAGLQAALDLGASVVIMKPRSLSGASLDLLEKSGALARAAAVIELGGEKQQVLRSLDREAAACLPYFAIIWIRPPAAPEGQASP